jgi:hypothetical protein
MADLVWRDVPEEKPNEIVWRDSPNDTTAEPLASSGFNQTFKDPTDTLYDVDLLEDENFIKASKILYKMNNGLDALNTVPLATEKDYGKYGIEMMGWFNYNMPKMTLDASRISGASDEQKRAFLYMMDAYDELGLSWNGTKRFFYGVALDPTTYLGLSTFGVGTVIGKGAQQATKAGVKSLLNQSIKGGMIAGVEAGVYTAVDDINRQVVETSVSGEDIDFLRVAKAGAVGTVAGGVLGAGVTAVAKKFTKLPKKADDTVDEEKLAQSIDDLPEMETPPVGDSGRIRASLDTVIKTIKKVNPGGKLRDVRPNNTLDVEALSKAVEPISTVLAKVATKNPEDVGRLLDAELTDAQATTLEVASNQTAYALKGRIFNLQAKQRKLDKNSPQADELQKQIEQLQPIEKTINDLDVALSSMTGRRLQARQQGGNTGLLRTLTSMDRTFTTVMKSRMAQWNQQQNIKQLNVEIEAARQRGDIEEFIKKRHTLNTLEEQFKRKVADEEGGIVRKAYQTINKPIKVANEVMIGFVFSPATVIINVVPSFAKMVYKPFLNNVMRDGLTKQALKTTTAEYSAMLSMTGTALKAARAAWRYERSVLTGDSARFLEDYNTIPKKFGGEWVRFFPRALLASDAFFETVHYRGFTVGNATAEAMEAGIEKGYTGTTLDNYVNEQVQKSLDEAYEPTPNAIDVLMDDGISRGLTGKKLENHVNTELRKNSDVFTSATNKEGRDYVQDILFKRDFSGKGNASKLARAYEGFVNRNPIMRMAGQLFFRTPVRVFEEGIRLTPGLNLISPNFMADLAGNNGNIRQIRAQGEALLAYSIAGSVFAMYSTGSITGSLGGDYKQRRQAENTGEIEPYQIKFSDGSSFNYRNFDPFATPVKIIVNALERAETLAYRAEQGERINESEMTKNMAMIAVATGSIAQSIRDANLASGVDAVFQLVEDIQDPEGSEQLIKFAGQKAQTFLPNTYYKFKMLQHPVLGDPATLEQFIRQRVNPDDPLVPKQYSAVGRARTVANPLASLIYFDRTTVKERQRDIPQKEREVEQFLYMLSQVGDANFTAPYKYKLIPNLDLRTRLTKDGTESLYDRWMKYYHESGVIDVLHDLRGLPMGTESTPGMAEQKAREVINRFRKTAFIRMYSEEEGLPEQIIDEKIRAIEARTGQLYSPNVPHNIGID